MSKLLIVSFVLFALLAVPASRVVAQIPIIPLLGMGDSIAEGVQSADANEFTQPWSFVNMIAFKANLPIPLPLIRTSPNGIVGNMFQRSRIDPFQFNLNLGVSGATVNGVINDIQNATDPSQFTTETNLVLFPFTGSQLQIAELLHPLNVIAWVGNNDVLGAITSIDQLNATQMTPIDQFGRDYRSMSARLKATGANVVVGTIPDVTKLGFLMGSEDVNTIFGTTFGMPPANKTTLLTVLLIALQIAPPNILQDPNFSLDPSEIEKIQNHIVALNQIIRSAANANGFAVADVGGKFNRIARGVMLNDVFGVSAKFLGGLVSLDAIHPSNTGNALIASEFISVFNSRFDPKVPPITDTDLLNVILSDPFVDLNGNGRVRGRPGAGFLETIMFQLGVTGDPETPSVTRAPRINAALASRVVPLFLQRTGTDLRTATLREKISAFKEAFGLKQFQRR
jgi:hypothetical protein